MYESTPNLLAGAIVEGIREAVFAFSGTDRLTDDLTSVAVRIDEPQPTL
jgi:hypothetical protein